MQVSQVLFNPNLNLKTPVNQAPVQKISFGSAPDSFARGVSSFATDLTQLVRTKFHTPNQFIEVLNKHPKASRFLGVVPESWSGGSADKAAQIQAVFTKFAKSTCVPDTKEMLVLDIPYDFKIKIAAKMLELKMNKILGKKTHIEPLDSGAYGKTFILNDGKENFVIKTFHTGMDGGYSIHGRGAEVLNACFASENATKGEFSDFYFGQFARKDDKDGFLVTKYIDKTNASAENVIGRRLYDWAQYIKVADDCFENHIGGTIIDFGHLEVNEDLADRKMRFIVKLIVETIDAQKADRIKPIIKQYGKTKEFTDAIKYLRKKAATDKFYLAPLEREILNRFLNIK